METSEKQNIIEDSCEKDKENTTTPSSGDWWKGIFNAARNKSVEVLEFVKKDFDELSTTVHTEATNVVQQTTAVFKETLQLDKPESTASSMKKSVSSFLGQVSSVLNPLPDDEDEEAVVVQGSDVVPLTRLQTQLLALAINQETYLKEIEDELLPRYEAWLELLEEQGNKQLSNENLIKMLVNNSQLQSNYEALVPNKLSHALFWNRFLFRKALLEDEDAEQQRKMKKTDSEEETQDDSKIENVWQRVGDLNYNVELSEEDQMKLLEDYEKEKQSKKLLNNTDPRDNKQNRKSMEKTGDPESLHIREKKDMVIVGDLSNSTTSSTYSSKGSTEEDWDKEINMNDVKGDHFIH